MSELKELIIKKKKLLAEIDQRMAALKQASIQTAEAYYIRSQIILLEQRKKELLKQTAGKNEEIKNYQSYFQDHKRLLREKLDSIQSFNNTFHEEYEACQKKFHTIQIRDTVTKGIKRLLLLQLCTIFFDKDNQRLFYGLHKLKDQQQQQQLSPQDEELLACAVGYLGLLLQYIARVKGIVLKNEFKFKGSRSYMIVGPDQQPLYMAKPSNMVKFFNAFQLLKQNLHQVLEELNIQRDWRQGPLPAVVGKIGEMLWVDA